jgi:hypothetical protein
MLEGDRMTIRSPKTGKRKLLVDEQLEIEDLREDEEDKEDQPSDESQSESD